MGQCSEQHGCTAAMTVVSCGGQRAAVAADLRHCLSECGGVMRASRACLQQCLPTSLLSGAMAGAGASFLWLAAELELSRYQLQPLILIASK